MSTPSEQFPSRRPTFAEVDLRAFDRNLEQVRRRLPEGSRMIAVLKADAYGHGAVELARRCAGVASGIAVALLEEALELRDAGIDLPILILGPLTAPQFDLVFERGLVAGIVGQEEMEAFAARARATGWNGEIHLKLDSGMGRMGFRPEDLERLALELQVLRGVRVAGIYTHFANASDPADPYTEEQVQRFESMLGRLRELGVDAPLHHLANSAAIVRGLVRPGEWVRAGIVLYGAEPLDQGGARLEPLLRWTTRIARVKSLPPGSPVGYGRTFVTARPSRIATLPVGYADGYSRNLSGRADVLVRGRRAPVVGRISMDLVTVDVTGVPGVLAGDEVTLLGRDGGEEIAAEELAATLGTISYEVLCAVGGRVPRLYRDGERVRLRERRGSEAEAPAAGE
ncbi:MAG TPA: alanine racemase [Thermoanaerobaculia bacterium]|nr:alanine racemase [Thermoanaerobaculia bacterium]